MTPEEFLGWAIAIPAAIIMWCGAAVVVGGIYVHIKERCKS